jgi:tripartite ATP-independent transporter DctM subunit
VIWSLLLFLLLLVLGMDVAMAMIAAAAVAILVAGADRFLDTVTLPLTMASGVDSFALVTVPLFVLAGELMSRGGLTRRLVDWALAMVGHWRGALAQVGVIVNLIMAGVSGSAVADAVATGRILVPEMRREGYRPGYAGAVIASAAMLGPIIPPSIPMVIYAVMANQSVVKLFMAGIVPGILLAGGYMAICAWRARREGHPARGRTDLPGRLRATRTAIFALLMPVIILAGIRFGIVTDTEAAAVAAGYALLVGVLVHRDLPPRDIPRAFAAAARDSVGVLFLLAAAGPFGWLLAESKVSEGIAAGILSVTTDPLLGLLLVMLLLLVVGCVLEPLPAMIVFLPALIPVGAALGIDPIHYGAVMVVNLMIGMLTPPVGLLLFVVASVGAIAVRDIVVEVLPFLAWSVTVLALICLFPGLVLWLPNLG